MPVFDDGADRITDLAVQQGRLATARTTFEEAGAGNASAALLIDDLDLSPADERLIEQVLEVGIGVDVIGVRTHLHQGRRQVPADLARMRLWLAAADSGTRNLRRRIVDGGWM